MNTKIRESLLDLFRCINQTAIMFENQDMIIKSEYYIEKLKPEFTTGNKNIDDIIGMANEHLKDTGLDAKDYFRNL